MEVDSFKQEILHLRGVINEQISKIQMLENVLDAKNAEITKINSLAQLLYKSNA
jgi:hypothetical protein